MVTGRASGRLLIAAHVRIQEADGRLVYRVDGTPVAGDIADLGGNHIAYVESVGPGTAADPRPVVTISEMNATGVGLTFYPDGHDTRSINDTTGWMFIHRR